MLAGSVSTVKVNLNGINLIISMQRPLSANPSGSREEIMGYTCCVLHSAAEVIGSGYLEAYGSRLTD